MELWTKLQASTFLASYQQYGDDFTKVSPAWLTCGAAYHPWRHPAFVYRPFLARWVPKVALCAQIAKAVGGGKNAARCEALYRKHQGYLSLPHVHHSEVAWQAMVQDSQNSGAPVKVTMCHPEYLGETLRSAAVVPSVSTGAAVMPATDCAVT